MNLTRISTMLRASALAALLVVGTSAAAFAAPIVNFTTTGTFGNTGTSTTTFTGGGGSVTLTFAGTNNSLDAPSNTNYGDIFMTTSGTFTGSANTSFTLGINQSAPTSGTGNFLGTVSGTIAKINQTDFMLTFSNTSLQIDGVNYILQPTYFLVPPSSGTGGEAQAGDTTIQGRLTATAVPEPASMMLLGTGLLAAFRARRKAA